MSRKRSELSSLIEMALSSRWPVAAALCGISIVVGFAVVPGMLASTTAFRPLAQLVRTFSLFPIVGFGVIAAIKFLRESTAGAKANRARGGLSIVQPMSPRSRTVYPGAPDDPIGPRRTEPFVQQMPTEWSLELLRAIEWKRFEEVVAAYFRAKNFRCETIAYGADGGVDGRLYFGDLAKPVGIVQCKAWDAKLVGVAPVREMLGVMTHERVGRGYFCATGEFSKDAIAFAAANPIKLITGRDLLTAIAQMPAETQRALLAVSREGDYTTPTCPSCGIKLVERTIGGKAAWGCRNYPRCKVKIFRKAAAASGPLDGLQRDQATLPARQQ